MALTDKKRRFADALMSGASQSEAAITAGYSERTAKQQGYRLARDPDVLAHIERRGAVSEAREQAKADGKAFNVASLAKMYSDPKDFLTAVMNDGGEDAKLRVDAAKALMPYIHAKPGEKGKKTERQERAEKVASKFSGLRAVK